MPTNKYNTVAWLREDAKRDYPTGFRHGECINLVFEPTDQLLPCPFCGRTNMTLNNTHTPSYWIECKCGAAIHGRSYYKSEDDHNDVEAHVKSKNNAIKKWNRRVQ